MRLKDLILVTVLACLILAAPATAADTIHLSIEPETAVQGESVSYKVTGTDTTSKGEEVWAYARIPGTSKCQSTGESEDSIQGHILGTEIKESSFEYTGSVPSEQHESPGTYLACAYIVLGGPKPTIRAASSSTFVVISKLQHEEEEEAAKKHEEEATAKATPLTPVVTPVPAPIVTPTSPTIPVVKPANWVAKEPVSKLAKALKQCKKLKKHSKRIKCERAAKKAAHHR